MPQISDTIYSDFSLSFIPHPETGELALVTNAKAVIQAFKTLVLTNYYERFQQPFLGSNARAYLFENIDSITASHLRDEIIRLADSDPRVNLISCTVTPEFRTSGYNVIMAFGVNTQTEPVTIKFFLQRLR